MAISRKELLTQIEGYKRSNLSLNFENKKLKDIINHYENFVSITYRGKSFNAFKKIQELSSKIGKKNDI